MPLTVLILSALSAAALFTNRLPEKYALSFPEEQEKFTTPAATPTVENTDTAR